MTIGDKWWVNVIFFSLICFIIRSVLRFLKWIAREDNRRETVESEGLTMAICSICESEMYAGNICPNCSIKHESSIPSTELLGKLERAREGLQAMYHLASEAEMFAYTPLTRMIQGQVEQALADSVHNGKG